MLQHSVLLSVLMNAFIVTAQTKQLTLVCRLILYGHRQDSLFGNYHSREFIHFSLVQMESAIH